MKRMVFSGHESFICKQFWLKKGFDFIKTGNTFNEKTSVVKLGVGKNMVSSIRYWLKVFGITEGKDEISELGEYLFGENGVDPYLEDIASVWLLHHSIVKLGSASLYYIVFNELRVSRDEFTKEQLDILVKNKYSEALKNNYNSNTVERDISVFLRNYLPPSIKKTQVEEAFSGLLNELHLLTHLRTEKKDWYRFESGNQDTLPFEIVLFSILDNETYDNTITFNDLYVGINSPGRIFALSKDGLFDKLQAISKKYQKTNYSETAGNRTFQITTKLNKWKILNDYYKK